MHIQNNNIQLALDVVSKMFQEKISGNYIYHSLDHSIEVMHNVREIGQAEKLDSTQLELAMIAGIFHDSGHIEGHHDHEKVSAEMARKFMEKHSWKEKWVENVVEAIRSTKYPQNPSNILSKVLCDADLMYLATTNFEKKSFLLWEEWKLTGQSQMSLSRFYTVSLQFLTEHKYHTRYGRDVLEAGKQQNIEKLKKIIQEGTH